MKNYFWKVKKAAVVEVQKAMALAQARYLSHSKSALPLPENQTTQSREENSELRLQPNEDLVGLF